MCKQILFLAGCFLIMSCGGSSNSSEREIEKYEETKAELAKREKKFPLEFLTVAADNNKNLIGQTVVKGTIENNATVTMYKNVRLKLLYYSNGAVVANHEEVFKDAIKANGNNEFKAKYFVPKNTDSVGVSVMSADVVE